MEKPEEEALGWFQEHWDPELSIGAWWSLLAESGWGHPDWPSDWFGRSASAQGARAVGAARRSTGAPAPRGGIASMLAGPTIIAHGTDEQRQRFVPDIAHGRVVWCQLFSEPGSGSDLAGLQTRAERDGDQWVVSGQKVWTSGTHLAKWGLLLARTDPDVAKHQGISYFLIDMEQPGIEVRPLREMTGRSLFTEVFLTEARVPAANLLGQPGDGWRIALTTLGFERASLGSGSLGSGATMTIENIDLSMRAGDLVAVNQGAGSTAARGPDLLIEMAREHDRLGDPLIRQELARAWTTHRIGEWTSLRAKASAQLGRAPGPEVSVGKLASTANVWHLGQTALSIAGDIGVLGADDAPRRGKAAELLMSSYVLSIGGGTSQIQRNIIGERVLGLSGERRDDKVLPFSDLPKN
ncbi:MAG: acyl-CoA dehydrogenase family protein [Actinomycetota bacterium]|nr:acyl-CoA dehydrogenase family protein [Actinomycetota bacterium]